MTSAWFLGAAHSVPQDESTVRDTRDPVRTDGDKAEMQAAPDWNEVESDQSGQLTGLSQRTVGAATTDSVKTAPALIGLATAEHNALIDRQVATSGTAASREAAGQFGHGTMQTEISLEPLNPAQAYGNDYFVRGNLSANEGSGDYMAPVSTDHWASAVAQASAKERSRDAYQSSLYNTFMAG